jgi:hypothetical protein
MTSDEDEFFMKIVALNEIYNILVLSFFIWRLYDAHKNNIKFYDHNNRV